MTGSNKDTDDVGGFFDDEFFSSGDGVSDPEFGDGGFPVDDSLHGTGGAKGVSDKKSGGEATHSKIKLSHKKVGIIIFASIVGLCVVLTVVSKINISRGTAPQVGGGVTSPSVHTGGTGGSNTGTGDRNTSSNAIAPVKQDESTSTPTTQTPSTGSSTSNDTVQNSTADSNTSDTAVQTGSSQDEVVSEVGSNKFSDLTEVDESSINYDTPLYKTTGSVKSKKVYMAKSGQLVYVLELNILSNNIGDSDYYCAYDAFSSINIGETVTVMYKKLSDNIYAITKVSK